jgi:hypothetical protein
MECRRFTRLTNAFSKKLANLKASVALHYAHYNLVRIHRTLRCTTSDSGGSCGSALDRAGIGRACNFKLGHYLTSRGFKITRDSYGKSTDWIYFTGTVAQAEETFHVTIVSTGPTKYATTDAMIPARFKGVIGSILGLENFGGGFMLRPLSRGPSNLDFMKRTESAGLHQFGAIPEITIGGITGFAPADFYTFYGAHAQRRNQWCRN